MVLDICHYSNPEIKISEGLDLSSGNVLIPESSAGMFESHVFQDIEKGVNYSHGAMFTGWFIISLGCREDSA